MGEINLDIFQAIPITYWIVEIPSMCAISSSKPIVYVPHPNLSSLNTIALENTYVF